MTLVKEEMVLKVKLALNVCSCY